MPEFSNLEIPGYTLEDGPYGGGMALVYIALQQSTRRRVAIKVIQPKFFESGDTEQYITRFKREAVFQANLTSPYIATLYELGVVKSLPFIVMEYLPGGDLDRKIRSARISPEGIKSVYTLREGLKYIKQVAHALQEAHEKGVIHRDIKPANIMFRHNGDAVLTDFGIAKATENASLVDDITRTQALFAIGTPRYMSPEQIKASPNTPVDARSDLYSLGATLFHVLSGRPPYVAESAMALVELHCSGPIPHLPKPIAHYDELIQKTLAKDPNARFSSAKEMIECIEKLERLHPARSARCLDQPLIYLENSVASDPKATTKKAAKAGKESRSALLIMGGGLLALMLFAGLFYFLTQATPNTHLPEKKLAKISLVINEQNFSIQNINSALAEINAALTHDQDDQEALAALKQLQQLTTLKLTEMIYNSQVTDVTLWLSDINPQLLPAQSRTEIETKLRAEQERITQLELEKNALAQQQLAKAEQQKKAQQQQARAKEAKRKAIDAAGAKLKKALAAKDIGQLKLAIKEATAVGVDASSLKSYSGSLEALRAEATLKTYENAKSALAGGHFDTALQELEKARQWGVADARHEKLQHKIAAEKEDALARQRKREKQAMREQLAQKQKIDKLLIKAKRLVDRGQSKDLQGVMIKLVPALKSAGLPANSEEMRSLLAGVSQAYQRNATRLVAQGEERDAIALLKNAKNMGVAGLDTKTIEESIAKKKAR